MRRLREGASSPRGLAVAISGPGVSVVAARLGDDLARGVGDGNFVHLVNCHRNRHQHACGGGSTMLRQRQGRGLRRPMRYAARKLLCIPALMAIGSCSGSYESRVVQFCLTSQNDAEVLRQTFRSIAARYDARFVDGSAETEESLRSLPDADRISKPSYPIVHIGVLDGRSGDLIATNQGLPPDQIAVGFSGNPKYQEVMDYTVRELNKRWAVKLNVGAEVKPLASCGNR